MTDADDAPLQDLLRELSPQVLGALVRRYRDFEACEDAVQEALVAASEQWPRQGVPDRPRAWLVTVASRRLVDELRSNGARRRREDREVRAGTGGIAGIGENDASSTLGSETGAGDDALELLFLCCHPALTPVSQMALTLRAVGGLTTGEIAAAFLVPEATMARRLSRAKDRLAEVIDTAGELGQVDPRERGSRLAVVLRVLYLVFNEGYATSTSRELIRRDLTAEAIRLTRIVQRAVPDETEVAGLLALMLLIGARSGARTAADGALIPIADQDRDRWDRGQIGEAVALLMRTLEVGRVGPYQMQASIAAVHAEALSPDETDWAEIRGLYRLLRRVDPSPLVTLNAVVAEAEVAGTDAAFELLATVEDDARLAGSHRVLVVRAHLVERSGDLDGAAALYLEAAHRTSSDPERRHLKGRARSLGLSE